MNERIRELVGQATKTLDVNHEGYRGKGYTEQVEFFDKEKFAELIVRECKQVLLGMIDEGQGEFNTLDQALTEINEYFGVEE